MLGLTVATLVGVPVRPAWAPGWAGALFDRRRDRRADGAAGLALGAVRPGRPSRQPLRELAALARKQVWLTLGIARSALAACSRSSATSSPRCSKWPACRSAACQSCWRCSAWAWWRAIWPARLADKALMPTVGGVLVWSALVLGAFVFTAPYPWLASLNVMLVGTAVALGPPLQIRLMDVAGDAQTLAAALNHSAFNLANALGAWLGGITIAAGLGWTSTGWVGMLALGGLAMFAWSLMSPSRAMSRDGLSGAVARLRAIRSRAARGSMFRVPRNRSRGARTRAWTPPLAKA
jgi:DHA1 family inner membrane transport protein